MTADEGVIRYGGGSSGTLHILFKTKDEQNPGDKVHDAVDRIERDLERRGFRDERNSETITYYRRKPKPKRSTAAEVARMILEFEERTGRTDHRVAPKRRKRKGTRTPGISNGMRPLVDPDFDQWPRDDAQGRHRIAWCRARKALRTAAEPWGDRTLSLVEHVVLQDREPLNLASKIPALKAALSVLVAHYGHVNYQQDLDAYIASETGKAQQWLKSNSLYQQKPPLGWKTKRLSTACRSHR